VFPQYILLERLRLLRAETHRTAAKMTNEKRGRQAIQAEKWLHESKSRDNERYLTHNVVMYSTMLPQVSIGGASDCRKRLRKLSGLYFKIDANGLSMAGALSLHRCFCAQE
jgi:hypothetical protein